jgi:hypothetical protein
MLASRVFFFNLKYLYPYLAFFFLKPYLICGILCMPVDKQHTVVGCCNK